MKIGALEAISLSVNGLKIDEIRELSSMDSDVSVSDISELLKKGSTYSDIKELLSFQSDEVGDNHSQNSTNESPAGTTDEDGAGSDGNVDYRKMYEESQKKLAEVQKTNINQNMAGKDDAPSDLELFESWAQSCM